MTQKLGQELAEVTPVEIKTSVTCSSEQGSSLVDEAGRSGLEPGVVHIGLPKRRLLPCKRMRKREKNSFLMNWFRSCRTRGLSGGRFLKYMGDFPGFMRMGL